MKAAFLDKPEHFDLREINLPEPLANEVRIKLKKVGICGSDMHLFQGHRLLSQPTVIGHEGLGFVDKIGANVKTKNIGDRVVVEPNINCGQCRFCLKGRGNICLQKRVLGLLENGCFAEYICVPEDFCWLVPQSVSDDNAVLIEPMAVAYHAVSKAGLSKNESIAIIGLGTIGMLVCHICQALGHTVYVSEWNEKKLQIALSKGAKSLNITNLSIKQYSEQNDIIAVFECAGSKNSASFAIEQAPRGAKVILTGLSEQPSSFIPLMLVREDIQILPSIIYNHPLDFAKVIDLLEKKVIDPSFILTGHSDLKYIQSAFESCLSGDHIKYIIELE